MKDYTLLFVCRIYNIHKKLILDFFLLNKFLVSFLALLFYSFLQYLQLLLTPGVEGCDLIDNFVIIHQLFLLFKTTPNHLHYHQNKYYLLLNQSLLLKKVYHQVLCLVYHLMIRINLNL